MYLKFQIHVFVVPDWICVLVHIWFFSQHWFKLYWNTRAGKSNTRCGLNASGDISLCVLVFFVLDSFTWSWLWLREKKSSSESVNQPQTLCLTVFKCCFHTRSSPAYALPRMYMKDIYDRPRTIFYTRMLNVIYSIDLLYVCAILRHSICNNLENVIKSVCVSFLNPLFSKVRIHPKAEMFTCHPEKLSVYRLDFLHWSKLLFKWQLGKVFISR